MGDELQKVIHFNPRLQHQVDHAEAFKACGFGVTSSPTDEADIHVISGPWFAYSQWRNHPRCLMIDRGWWGDPNYVSIGWLQTDGSRKFASGDKPRPVPVYEPWKTRDYSCLILADYGQDIADLYYAACHRFGCVRVRKHPADETQPVAPLSSALRLHDVAICTSGSAGFEAIMQGLPTICLDPHNPIAPVCSASIDAPLYKGERDEWLHGMSYKQWSLAEIASGEAWEHLKDIM